MSSGDYQAMHARIAAWYARHGRKDLPWRVTDDPYHIYISEVMLQQTQVATVLSRYYFQFLEQFPTLQALADAPLESVLKAWEGLGYYTRARNLHKAAQMAAPALPDTVEALLALPGIGRNTAHAIAAFAFHRPVAVMEANVKRVLHRVTASHTMTDAALWQAAAERVDADDPFTYNQAMMDIGATLCLPKTAHCTRCPLEPECNGRDQPLVYPAPKVKKAVPVRNRVIIVFEHEERYYMQPRTENFLSGLYRFIEVPGDQRSVTCDETRYDLDHLQPVGCVRQAYSHFVLDAEIYRINHTPRPKSAGDWYSSEAMAALPVSNAEKKIMRLCALV